MFMNIIGICNNNNIYLKSNIQCTLRYEFYMFVCNPNRELSLLLLVSGYVARKPSDTRDKSLRTPLHHM